MKLNREALLTIALLLFLAALTVAGVLAGADSGEEIPLDSASTSRTGTRALYEWLEALDYQVSDEVGESFAIPIGTDLALVLEPIDISPAELEEMERFVQAGGILIYAGENFTGGAVPAHFEVNRSFALEPGDTIAPVLPIFSNPPLEAPLPFTASSVLIPEFDEFLPLAAVGEGPVVLSFAHGSGTVILSALTHPFTNAGLKEPEAGIFLLNLLDEIPENGRVWFDEWHHGRRTNVVGPAGPGDWLRRTPSGRAVLFSVFALFIWIAVSGRAFGRPERTEVHTSRRAPLEYITAIADLNQRAGNRAHLMAHYHRRLKRKLAARYRIDPGLPDEVFIETLRQYDPDSDVSELAAQLAGLRETDISEADMVKQISEAANGRMTE